MVDTFDRLVDTAGVRGRGARAGSWRDRRGRWGDAGYGRACPASDLLSPAAALGAQAVAVAPAGRARYRPTRRGAVAPARDAPTRKRFFSGDTVPGRR